MSDPTESHGKGTVIGFLIALVVPVVLTVWRIEDPGQLVISTENPTPHGYTWSLTLFVLPCVYLVGWHIKHVRHTVCWNAVWCASAVIFLLGAVLDFFFGYGFFHFPNPEATVGVRLPAFHWAELQWVPDYLPIEEFGFYLLGGLFMLLMYVFTSNDWLELYTPPHDTDAQPHALFQFDVRALVVGALVIAGGFYWKRNHDAVASDNIPGYLIFLVVLAVLPTVLFFRGVQARINWRALGFSFAVLVLISIMWEATLGVPYGWWNYKPELMTGIFVRPWSYLPIEAVLLWLVASWGAVVAYECFRLYFLWKLPIWQTIFGPTASAEGRRE